MFELSTVTDYEDQTPDVQRAMAENAHRQAELIHITHAYHRDRILHGQPVVLANPLRDKISMDAQDEAMVSHRPNLGALARSIINDGLKPLDVMGKIRESHDVEPIHMMMEGMIASIWDSISHVLGQQKITTDERYAPFLEDSDLRALKVECDAAGEKWTSFQGSGTLYTGFSDGFPAIRLFLQVQYGPGRGKKFDAATAARIFGKSDKMGLNTYDFDHALYSISQDPKVLDKYHASEDVNGIPSDTIKKQCNPKTFGCPARLPIGPRATEILQRHGLYEQTYEGNEKEAAITLITRDIRTYVFANLDRIFSDLTEEEQRKHLSPGSIAMLKSSTL